MKLEKNSGLIETNYRVAILPDQLDNFIYGKIFKIKQIESKNFEGANLRLLNIYLELWENSENYIYLNEIDEQEILDSFSTVFKFDDLDTNKLNTLHYFSAISQFDVPFVVNNNSAQYNFLENFAKDGLCYKKGGNFYLAHSIDAQYICKAICKREGVDFYEKSSEFVRKYIEEMFNSPNSEFASYFIQISKELKKKSFNVLLKELCDISTDKWASKILTQLDIGFFNIILSNAENKNKNEILKYYISKKTEFKDMFLSINPIIVAAINNCLKKYYNYNCYSEDLFCDVNEVRFWLNRLNASGSIVLRILKDISKISSNHKIEIEKYKEERKRKGGKIKDYYFNTLKLNDKNIRINKDYIRSFYSTSNELKYNSKKISLILKNSFYFDNISWAHLSRFFDIIKKYCLNPESKIVCCDVSKLLFEKILLIRESLKYANAKELSLTFMHIATINECYYYEILEKKLIVKNVKHKLNNFSYEDSELYLLSHFANTNWGILKIKYFVENANEIQKNKLIDFYYVELNKSGEKAQENTLVYCIYKNFIEK